MGQEGTGNCFYPWSWVLDWNSTLVLFKERVKKLSTKQYLHPLRCSHCSGILTADTSGCQNTIACSRRFMQEAVPILLFSPRLNEKKKYTYVANKIKNANFFLLPGVALSVYLSLTDQSLNQIKQHLLMMSTNGNLRLHLLEGSIISVIIDEHLANCPVPVLTLQCL